MGYIRLLQYWWALVNMVTNFWVPKMLGISQLQVLTRLSRRMLLQLLLAGWLVCWVVSQSVRDVKEVVTAYFKYSNYKDKPYKL